MAIYLGDIAVDLVDTGSFRLDGGAMFGVVPKVLWQRTCPADERNRIVVGLNSLLIRTGDAVVVVDTGLGQDYDQVFADRYSADPATGIVPALAAHSVGPEDVTHVVLTHLHFDHAAGNCRRAAVGDGWVPTFPNARYLVPERELLNAAAPDGRSEGSYWPHTWEVIAAAGQLDAFHDSELLPGIRARHAPGHTAGHHVVVVRGGQETLCFVADLLPTEQHLRPAWIMAYDLYPAETLATKQLLLTTAAAENWILAFQHSANARFARVARDGSLQSEVEG